MSRGRPSGRPTRRVTRSGIRREILVFVEGLKTEEHYIKDWFRRHRERVLVTIDPFRGGPAQLVERAIRTKNAEARDARRGRGRAHDETWCVFDIDEHPNIASALADAETHGIKVAISNPCLELWFILHFEDQTAYIERERAQARSNELLGCGKSLTEQALKSMIPHYQEAMHRAQQLDAKHQGDASPPGSNPSSGVWRLIERVRGA